MPADFLLPLFTLTLLANAILVAFAIRGLRRGQFDPDRPSGFDRPPGTPHSVPRADPPISDELAVAGGSAPPAAPDLPVEVDPPTPRKVATPSPAPTNRRRAIAAGEGTGSGRARPAEPARRGRRRFSLPPLDDDHEKVSRSIETFLGGVEMGADASSGDEAAASGTALSAGATTVALVAVEGLPGRPRRSRSARGATDDDAVASALAMVERTIRGAARGSDIVSVPDRGRFRIVLPATGELAARAYLRRIRATIEPLLESADRPLRLAVATATVLDEPIADAVRRADVRLAAALAAMTAPETAHPAADPMSSTPHVPAGADADGDPEDSTPAREPRAAAD